MQDIFDQKFGASEIEFETSAIFLNKPSFFERILIR